MTIIAVRHTSVVVPVGVCYGQTDVELASTFEIEKEQVVQRLLPQSFQAVYSSPLTRCRKLTEFVSKGIPVIYDSRLMELNFGKWEGCNWSDIEKTEEAKLWFSDWLNMPCTEGESYKQLITRVEDFLKHIFSIHSRENVLIVSHGGVIRALVSLISGTDPQRAFDLKIDYGSITVLNI
jgi:alpha-ribazole phosphatase